MSSAPHKNCRILALSGSLRSASYNCRLLQLAATVAPHGMHVEIYEALRDVPLFNEDVEAAHPHGPVGVRHLRDAVAAADGMIISTPEYNQSMPGVLKNAIDWLSRDTSAMDSPLDGKPVAIMGATTGRWGTRLAQAALRQTLTATGSLVMPTPMLFIGEASARLVSGVDSRETETLASLRAFLEAFHHWLNRFASVQVAEAKFQSE